MSVFKTAYNTTACAGWVMKKTHDGILEGIVRGYVRPITPGDETVAFVDGQGVVNEIIPAFNHPMTVEYEGKIITVSDVRAVGKYDDFGSRFVARMGDEYKAIKLRTYLQAGWVYHGPSSMSGVGGMPMALYASWIGENVGKRFALDARDQFMVTIFAAIFYMNLFSDAETLSNTERGAMAGNVARITGFKAGDVYDQVQAHPVIKNVEEFCEICRNYTESTRLRDLNSATLIGVLGGTWWGANARELTAVALEHPPTWLTIVYEAITQRGFKNSPIAKMLERSQFRRDTEQFVRQLGNLPFVPTEPPRNSNVNAALDHYTI